jgi:hypothetical protein
MEHIKLSEEEKQRLIEMLESDNTEDHILAHGIMSSLGEFEYDHIMTNIGLIAFINYWIVKRNSEKI